MGEWRILHKQELCHSYSSPSVRIADFSRLLWIGQVTRMDEVRNTCRTVMRMLVGQYTDRRPKRRWGDNIKINRRETACECNYL